MSRKRNLVWLNWPESAFRLSAGDFREFRRLFPGESVAVKSKRAFLRELPSATMAVCWEFDGSWFARAPKLEVLATPGAGRELLPAESELPRTVRKIHGAFHGAIMSETVLAYMLAWCRGLYKALEIQHSHAGGDPAWGRAELSPFCSTLAGSEAVILGYGKIGRAIGAKLEALGAKVKGISRANIGELPAAVRSADWLICALPSDTGTDNMVDAALLRKMKRSAVLINVGRGNAIDEAALARALSNRRLAAAFLDVFAAEPLRRESPLAGDLPGLYRFPHGSAFAPDYLKRFFAELAGELSKTE